VSNLVRLKHSAKYKTSVRGRYVVFANVQYVWIILTRFAHYRETICSSLDYLLCYINPNNSYPKLLCKPD